MNMTVMKSKQPKMNFNSIETSFAEKHENFV